MKRTRSCRDLEGEIILIWFEKCDCRIMVADKMKTKFLTMMAVNLIFQLKVG